MLDAQHTKKATGHARELMATLEAEIGENTAASPSPTRKKPLYDLVYDGTSAPAVKHSMRAGRDTNNPTQLTWNVRPTPRPNPGLPLPECGRAAHARPPSCMAPHLDGLTSCMATLQSRHLKLAAGSPQRDFGSLKLSSHEFGYGVATGVPQSVEDLQATYRVVNERPPKPTVK